MKDDYEIRKLMKQESAGAQLTAFMLAAIFGAAAGAVGVMLREILLDIARRLIYSAELEINQYTGFMHMAEIGSIGMLAAVWLLLVLIVWHRIGREFEMRKRLAVFAGWTVFPAAALIILWMLNMIL